MYLILFIRKFKLSFQVRARLNCKKKKLMPIVEMIGGQYPVAIFSKRGKKQWHHLHKILDFTIPDKKTNHQHHRLEVSSSLQHQMSTRHQCFFLLFNSRGDQRIFSKR